MFYLIVFILPAAFVFLLGALLALFLETNMVDWLMGVGWDAHVLAWGALGGVFAHPGIARSFSGEQEFAAVELVCVAVLLLLAVLSLALRRRRPYAGWRVVCALALGGFSVAVPIAVALHAHM